MGHIHKAIAVAGILATVCLDPNAHAQSSPPSQITGPSFPCPSPRDPLAQLICENPPLSRLDLAFVQTYQSLRQQLVEPAQQLALRQESVDFGLAVRSTCGIALAQSANSKAPLPPAAPPWATGCVIQAYERQRAIWQSNLTGAAAEEAARPIEQQIALQGALQTLKFLAPNDPLDGVFGGATRAAIIAWQNSAGRETSGLLGNSDARILLQASSDAVIADQQNKRRLEEQKKAAERRDARLQELRTRYGAHAEAIIDGEVQLGMTKQEVLEARGNPTRQDSLPPNYELWVYSPGRIAFTDQKVTHVGH
jgi:hypothetical protein